LAEGVPDARVRSALDELVSGHEILRTTFVQVAGMRIPQQAIREELAFAWHASTLHDHEPLQAVLDSILTAEAAALDLEDGPVLRAHVTTLPGSERILVLTAAAACLDAESALILLREIGRICRGGSGDGEPLQYADYAEWRRQLLEDDPPEAEAEQPTHAPQLLFGRAAAEPAQPTRIPFQLAAEDASAVRAAAAELHVRVAVFLEACLHALVARLSGEPELSLAGHADGREQAELAGAVGPYAQLVPIRSRAEAGTTFAELVDQVRRARADAVRRQDHATARELAGVARAGIGFTYRELAPDDDLRALGTLVRLEARTGPLALEVAVHDDGETLGCELAYGPGSYDRTDADRVARSFATLVRSAAIDPTQPVAALALLDDGERERVLALADGGTAAIPTTPVHIAFERHVAARPEALAVTDGSVQLSYAELNAAANRLAHHLRALGVERGRVVAHCFDRTAGAIVGVLAILKAGGAFVPLNFEHPHARLSHQLEESDAAVLVTQEHLVDRLPAFAGPVVCLDRDEQEPAAEAADDPPPAGLEDVAYVIYTSGSTGSPKGVAVTHGNLANYTARMLERLGAEGQSLRFAVVSALSTDLGYTSLFPALASGGSVHLVGPEVAIDPEAFAAHAGSSPIDVLKITPSLLGALVGAGSAAVLPRRWLVCGGEPFTFDLLDRIRGLGGSCRILNHYGPTETTIGTCVHEIEGELPRLSATVPIGRPLANTRAYVVDAAGAPLPIGVAGELWVGGAGVARGYVNRPDETAERFAADPFDEGRVYRTGDRARVLPDGTLEFLGRIDQQVKIHGYRIEPEEIEATLLRHAAVRQVAVVAHGAADDQRLAAYVVASPQPASDELLAFAREWLPDYMVPTIVPIDVLPLTPSGKVDRRALPDPATVQRDRSREFVAPRTEIEHELAEIWRELLGVERVGVTDDFFALGGHSLLATQMITRIRRRHGDVPLRALFTAPTIAALAEAVGRNAGNGTGDA
jgi:amino acid adenylation domain-containing protein